MYLHSHIRFLTRRSTILGARINLEKVIANKLGVSSLPYLRFTLPYTDMINLPAVRRLFQHMIVSDPSIPPSMHNFIMDKVSFVQSSARTFSSLLSTHRNFSKSFNTNCPPTCKCAMLKTLVPVEFHHCFSVNQEGHLSIALREMGRSFSLLHQNADESTYLSPRQIQIMFGEVFNTFSTKLSQLRPSSSSIQSSPSLVRRGNTSILYDSQGNIRYKLPTSKVNILYSKYISLHPLNSISLFPSHLLSLMTRYHSEFTKRNMWSHQPDIYSIITHYLPQVQHEKFASPLDFHPAFSTYFSLFPQDTLFGSMTDSFSDFSHWAIPSVLNSPFDSQIMLKTMCYASSSIASFHNTFHFITVPLWLHSHAYINHVLPKLFQDPFFYASLHYPS